MYLGLYWGKCCIFQSKRIGKKKLSGFRPMHMYYFRNSANTAQHRPAHHGTCFTATCDLCGNGKYGGLADIHQSSEHGARPTRNQRARPHVHPTASIRPRSSAPTRVFELGAEHAAACGYSHVIPDDSGGEEERVDGARSRSTPFFLEPAVGVPPFFGSQ